MDIFCFKNTKKIKSFCFLCFLLFFASLSFADEGMWLFSNPPKEKIREKYGFEITPEFLDLLQKSSIRFGNGGSGSFVSSQGLVMTNHHVAVSSLQKLSKPGKDLVRNGFYAPTPQEELKCEGLELIQLMEIQDVSEEIHADLNAGSPENADQIRKEKINQIEQEGLNRMLEKGFARSSLKCEVVSFYEGGLYHLYIYRRFADVRLVFAPEESVGFFGGDPDNFEFPRYVLDVSFFRIYDKGAPYHPEKYLRWSSRGAKEGELVFVSGHPGRTNRFNTMDHLFFQRDEYYPYLMSSIRRKEVLLQTYAQRGKEEARQVASELFSIQNRRKNREGILLGLQTPDLIRQKFLEEQNLMNALIEKNLVVPDKYDPWKSIKDALEVYKKLMIPYDMLERGSAFDSELFKIARSIVRIAEESEKSDEKRLMEYRDSVLSALKENILNPGPIYPEAECIKLTSSLGSFLESQQIPPFWKKILKSQSPRQKAIELLSQTKLTDPAERKRLLDLDLASLKQENDPMIQLALTVDPTAREIRSLYEKKVQDPLRKAYTAIAQARFQLKDANYYPDATFTLRLSYGKIAGYIEDNGKTIPPWTFMSGAFQHAEKHDFIPPYDLAESWIKNKKDLDLSTPLNIISTNDIIGGNSGSPLINTKGEIVGLIFDGNIQSLVANFIYTDKQARALSVHSSAIQEGLQKIYRTDRILNELGK
ncbi:MAG: S46 family peptidase [Planctomycetia bacterium]|nr:S46 family peptidase [Planctomycetia bacterium]